MALKYLIFGVVAVAFLGATALTLPAVLRLAGNGGDSAQDNSLSTVLSTSQMLDLLHLYSGEPDSVPPGARLPTMSRGTDLTAYGGIAYRRFLTNTDGSIEDIHLQPDGQHFAVRETFYPQQPGEYGWRHHLTQIYAGASDLVVAETINRLDGTVQEQTTTGENGSQHVIGYGADGLTVIHELIVSERADKWSKPILQSDQRWREDASRSLAYSNVLNPADKKRLITFWDDQHRPLKVIVPNEYGSHYGTSITAYYPGTTQVRMQSTVDAAHNTAQYFRPDGTLDHVLLLSQGYTIVRYFDTSGKTLLLEQWWERKDDDKGSVKPTYVLSTIHEFDASGEKTREVHYWNGKLGMIEILNVELAGVKYGQIDYVYDADTKTLKTVKYWLGKAEYMYDKEETHTPEEKLTAPVLPADLLTMRINPDEDGDLLLPDPMSFPG